MKLQVVCFLAALLSSAAFAQAAPPQQQPGYVAGYVAMDKHCKEVHPGDTVSYSLTIEGLSSGQPVFADLQMRPLHELPLHGHGLPAPDFRNLGGGGTGQVSGIGQSVFDFSFVVPTEILPGRYRGVEVRVKANEPLTAADAPRYVDVSHHTMKRVHSFCLTVVSNYGNSPDRPEVTNFQSGAIVPK